jgi:hypothetical protein
MTSTRKQHRIENLVEALISTPAAAAAEPHDMSCLLESGRRLALEIGAATTQVSG